MVIGQANTGQVPEIFYSKSSIKFKWQELILFMLHKTTQVSDYFGLITL